MNPYKNFKRPQQNFKRRPMPINNQNNCNKVYTHIPDKFESFCQKKFIHLDDNTSRQLYHQLTQQYKYNNQAIMKLNQVIGPEYLITINKKNKYNFLLFLTKINGKNYSVFIYNKNGKLYFYSVKFSFNEQLYTGTLFNGELVKNEKDCWIYYISDLLYMKSKYYQNNRMSHKLQTLAEIMKNDYEYDEFMNVCHLQIKSYFLYNHLQFIKKDCQIMFVPEYYGNIYVYDVVLPKKEEVIIKNNEVKEFIIKSTGQIDVYELYEIKTNTFDSIACVSKVKTSIYLKEQFKNKDSFIIKAKYSTYFSSWVPIN